MQGRYELASTKIPSFPDWIKKKIPSNEGYCAFKPNGHQQLKYTVDWARRCTCHQSPWSVEQFSNTELQLLGILTNTRDKIFKYQKIKIREETIGLSSMYLILGVPPSQSHSITLSLRSGEWFRWILEALPVLTFCKDRL